MGGGEDGRRMVITDVVMIFLQNISQSIVLNNNGCCIVYFTIVFDKISSNCDTKIRDRISEEYCVRRLLLPTCALAIRGHQCHDVTICNIFW